MKYFFSLILIISASLNTNAAIRYVRPIPAGSGNGTSWNNASNDLQGMINASAIGDQIWVAAGVYKPASDPQGLNPSNQREKTFTLKGDVSVYGGFAGTETSILTRNIAANATVLSGDLGIVNDTSDNAYHVVLLPLSAISLQGGTLDGFEITGGNATGSATLFLPNGTVEQNMGGGIYSCSGSRAVTYRNLRIHDNHARSSGGGLLIASGDTILLLNNNIYNNSAGEGGGAVIGAGAVIIDSCTFSGNMASGNGGGVANGAGYCTFKNSNICNNTSGTYGGGILVSGGYQTYTDNYIYNNAAGNGGGLYITQNWFNNEHLIANNVVYNNTALHTGGGIYHYDGHCMLANNTIFNNSAQVEGGGLHSRGIASYYNNIFWLNKKNGSSTIAGADVSVPPPSPVALTILTLNNLLQLPASDYQSVGDTANIFALDPMFANPAQPLGVDGVPRTADDGLMLLPCSPVINEGITTLPPTPADVVNNGRLGRYDMGAYEFQGIPVPAVPAPITGSGTICVNSTAAYANSVMGGAWSSSDTLIARVSATGQVTGIAAGTATVYYTVTGGIGCANSVASKAVTINATPAAVPIAGPGALCKADTILLSNAIPGGIWVSNNNLSAIVSGNGQVTGVGAGIAVITYKLTNSFGCTDSSTHPIIINEAIVTTSQNGTVLRATGNQNAATYLWMDCDNGQPIPGETNATYTAISNGRYSVIVSYMGCIDTSQCLNVTGLGFSMANRPSSIIVSPNPASEYVRITTGSQVTASVRLSNVFGKVVREMDHDGVLTVVDIRDLAKGIYYLQVSFGKEAVIHKLVIW